MAEFVAIVIAGLATGALYALVAVGFTLLWQTSQTINFAQGEFVMLPAFFMLAAMQAGLPFWAAIILGFVLSTAILGFAFKRLLVDPMLRHGVLPLAIATMALSTFLKESVKTFYSAEASPFPSLAPTGDLHLFGVAIAWQNIAVLVVAIAAVIGLQFLLDGTRTGRQMQAAAQNPTVARILGVPVERMILYTFLINGALRRAGLSADHADLSGQVHQRRGAGPRRLHRGDRRRLQPDTRRHRGRPAARRRRQSGGGLCLDAISRRDPADPADRGHPVPARRIAGTARGANRMKSGHTTVMPGLVPGIHVVTKQSDLRKKPNPRGSLSELRYGRTTWVAGTSPAMTHQIFRRSL